MRYCLVVLVEALLGKNAYHIHSDADFIDELCCWAVLVLYTSFHSAACAWRTRFTLFTLFFPDDTIVAISVVLVMYWRLFYAIHYIWSDYIILSLSIEEYCIRDGDAYLPYAALLNTDVVDISTALR